MLADESDEVEVFWIEWGKPGNAGTRLDAVDDVVAGHAGAAEQAPDAVLYYDAHQDTE